ncbi:T-cell activation inhibitor, mitochondrial-like [Diadema setosum]|uniref:T-cell activation inhibitor, mitochondrial-like n=1 Tax=Diadema setosum TaxID=31175 RepID=UPI003B3A0363
MMNPPNGSVLIRCLTSAQTTEALRPFLFAVHPDFFGQHPRARETNERSLQQLFAYIDDLQTDKRVTATELTFYLRNGRSTALKSVNINLTSLDVYTTVRGVLESCTLSTALVDRYKQENDAARGVFPRPVEWHHSYYEYTGKKNPNTKVHQRPRKPDITLSYWLKTNIKEARRKLASSQPIRDDIESLRRDVIRRLDLVDVRWDSMWDVVNFRACLRTVLDLCQQHVTIMQNLRGCTIVLGDVTRLMPSGTISLGSQEVPHQWLSLVASLPREREILRFIPPMERRLSSLLGGCSIGAAEIVTTTARSHHSALTKMVETIENDSSTAEATEEDGCKEAIMPQGSLEGVHVIVEGSSGQQYMDYKGNLHVMCNSSVQSLTSFLQSNSHQARELHARHKSNTKEEACIIAGCLEEMDLATLTRDLTVTPLQMITCCRQLRQNPLKLGVTTRGLHLQVTHRYALMRGGEICIPWNWK